MKRVNFTFDQTDMENLRVKLSAVKKKSISEALKKSDIDNRDVSHIALFSRISKQYKPSANDKKILEEHITKKKLKYRLKDTT